MRGTFSCTVCDLITRKRGFFGTAVSEIIVMEHNILVVLLFRSAKWF